MTTKPHVHAEVIKAWADGKQIQMKSELTVGWVDLLVPHPSWHLTTEYRVKPKTIRYRVALLDDGVGYPYPYAVASDDVAHRVYGQSNFKRWLTDWTEAEAQ